VDVTRVFEGIWLVLWVLAAIWLLSLLGARSCMGILGTPWRAGRRLRRRLLLAKAPPPEDADADGFPRGHDARGRRCYIPAPGVYVYPVGHRHPISGEPRVCVRRLDGAAVFCDRAGRPLRRLPAGLAGAAPELYLPLEELEQRSMRFGLQVTVVER